MLRARSEAAGWRCEELTAELLAGRPSLSVKLVSAGCSLGPPNAGQVAARSRPGGDGGAQLLHWHREENKRMRHFLERLVV